MGTDGFIDWELPASKRKIKFILATHKIEKAVQRELDARRKINKSGVNPEITTRLKHMIVSVDDNEDKKYITNFVDNEFLSIDSIEFRRHMLKRTPDVDMSTFVEIDGKETLVTIPVTVRFFWPDTRI